MLKQLKYVPLKTLEACFSQPLHGDISSPQLCLCALRLQKQAVGMSTWMQLQATELNTELKPNRSAPKPQCLITYQTGAGSR